MSRNTPTTGVQQVLSEYDPGLTRSAVLPLVGVVLAEVILFTGRTQLALGTHLVTLFACTLGPLAIEDVDDYFQLFALVPIFRLANLGMPVFLELTVYWFPLIYAPLIPAAYVIARGRDGLSIPLGVKPALVWLPVALPFSAFLGWVEYQVIEPGALVPAWNLPNLLVISVVMIGFVGFVEELLFRSVLQRDLQNRMGKWTGLAIASGLFGLMHSGYGVGAELAFATTIGLIYGLVYDYTDSLLLITLMHGVLNIFLFAVVPLQPGWFAL